MKRTFSYLGLFLVLLIGAWFGLPRAGITIEPVPVSTYAPSPRVSTPLSSPPAAAPLAARLVESVAAAEKPFPSRELVASSSIQGPDGDAHVSIIRTTFKYPLVRIVAKDRPAKAEAPVAEVMVADHLIVRPVETITPAAFADRIRQLGFSVRRHNAHAGIYLVGFPLVPGRTDGLDVALARLVEAEDAVASAEPDYIVGVTALPAGESAVADGQLWALNNTGRSGGIVGADIDAAAAWAVAHDASDVVVAVIDSGIHFAHADLAASLWTNPAEIPGNGIDDDANGVIDDVHGFNAYAGNGGPSDDNGHGTHCAGIIAADGHNASGVVGVAWRSRLMAVKFLSADGVGVTSDAIESIDYAVDNGAHILNLSWGGGSYSASLFAALQRARAAGVVVVAAAGNDSRNNDNTPVYPAGYDLDNIVSVAATDHGDALAWFSNYGPARVHIAAPGAEILSTWIGGSSATKILSGTSMAAPHVSGVTALLASRFPADTHRQRINRVLGGAETIADLAVARSARLNLLGSLTTGSPSPVNDAFAEAAASTLNGVVWRGDNTHATAEPGEPAHVSGAALHSVWYRWTAPVAGSASLAFAPAFPGRAAVYTGSTVSSLTAVASTAGAPITFNVTAGVTYRVAVDGNAGAAGPFSLSLSIPPANDDKAAATVVTGESWSVPGTNLGAGLEPGETAHANVPGGRSVWWRWTAPLDGPVRIGTDGSDFDTSLAVYDDAGVQAIIQGERPDLVLVIDVSGSTGDTIKGGYVGDTNGDGRANTILDAEVAAALALRQILIESGKPSRVSVVKFSDTAALLDMDPVTPGVQSFTTVSADLDNNGVPDVIQALRTLRAVGLTNYTDGLAKASDVFAAMGTAPGDGTLVFLSDGKPSDSGNFGAVAASLRASGHLLHAFGAGGGSSLASLQLIAPQALIFTDIAELIAVFNGAVAANDDHSGLLTSQVNFTARAGHTYSIAVDGYKGAAGTIQLAVQYSQAITIISQPRDTSVERFAPARFDVGVRGVAPFNYQWFKDGVLIPEATGASLIIDQADIADAGAYHVVVNNTFTTVTSHAAILDVIVRAPVITRELVNQALVAGSQAVFRAPVVGTAPFTYQWFKNGVAIEDATQSELVIASVSASDAGAYHVVITNTSGSVTSNTAILSLADSPFDAWVRRSPQFAPHGVVGVVFLDGKFFVHGYNGFIATSLDGKTWSNNRIPGAYFGEGDTRNSIIREIRLLDGKFYALGQNNAGNLFTLHRSTDGISWENLPNPNRISRLDYIDGAYVGSGLASNGRTTCYASADLQTWAAVGQFGYERIPLLASGATWKYLPNITGFPTNWTSNSFNDSAWASGPAILGFGNGNAATTVPSGATTTLFRITVPSAKNYTNARLVGRLLADDGALIYFNGGIAHRQNMGSDWPSAHERAATDISGAAESTYVNFSGLYTYSVRSSNVFAVQVHQSLADPSDMSFDLEADIELFYQTLGPVTGNGRMVVMRSDGKTFTSTDGLDWTRHDNTGLDNAAANQFFTPTKLAFINGQFLAWNVTSKRIYKSTDGVTWTLHTTTNPPDTFGWDGQKYFHVSGASIGTSTDAITWTRTIVSSIYGAALKATAGAHGNGTYVLVNHEGVSTTVNQFSEINGSLLWSKPSQGRRLRILDGALVSLSDDSAVDSRTWVSNDGATWKPVLTPTADLSYGHDTYLRFSLDTPLLGYDLSSPSLTDYGWTASTDPRTPGFTPASHLFADDRFVAVGPKGAIATSSDAKVWTIARAAVPTDPDLTRIDYLGGRFIAIGRSGLVLASSDASTWTSIQLPTTANLAGLAYGDGRYVIGTSHATETEFFVSADAITWTRVAAGDYGAVRDITHGDGHFAAVTGRRIVFSADAATWATTDLPNDEGWAIAHYKGTYVVVGSKGSVFQAGTFQTSSPAPVLGGIEIGAKFTANDPLRAVVTGSSSGSGIVSVDFILNGELVSRLDTGPFVWSGTAGLPGDYRLSVVARDADGNVSFTHTTFTVSFSPWQRVGPNLASMFVNTFTAPDGTLYGLGGENLGVGKRSVIARSRDGLDWRQVHGLENEDNLVQMVASDNGILVATGNAAYVLTSRGGEKWERVNLPLGGVKLSWGNGLFVAVPGNNPSFAFVSVDGLVWDQVNFGSQIFGANVSDLAFHDGRFHLATRGTSLFESLDGVVWTRITPTPLEPWSSTPKFVTGDSTLCIQSSDLFEYTGSAGWVKRPRSLGVVFSKLFYGEGLFVGINTLGIYTSPDLLTWTQTYTMSSESDPLVSARLAWIDGRWLAYAKSFTYPYVATSTDTVAWQARLYVDASVPQRATDRTLAGLATDGEQLLAVGSYGLLQRTTNGRIWEQQPYIGPESLSFLVYAENTWVAAGTSGAVYTSPDGVTWTKRTTGTTRALRGILHNGDRFVIYGDQVILSSADAQTWTAVTTVNDTGVLSLFGGIVTQGRFAILSSDRYLYASNDGVAWNRSDIGIQPSQHHYRIVESPDGILIPGGYSGVYGNYIIKSADLLTWTPEYRDMPDLYHPAAAILNTRFSTQDEGDGDLRFSLDAGASWFTVDNHIGYAGVAAFKGSYYAVGYDLRIDAFSLVDLQPANAQLTTDPSPGPGSPVHLEWDILNRGYIDHTDSRPLRIEVRLGRTPDELNHTDLVLVDETFDDALAVGQALRFSRDLVLPPDIAVGDYYLKVRVDGLSHLSELNESNNVFLSEEPALTIQAWTLSVTQTPGGVVRGGLQSGVGTLSTARSSAGGFVTLGTRTVLANRSLIDLVAVPAKGFGFVGWLEHPSQTFESLSLEMDRDHSVTPLFSPLRTVTTTVQGQGVVSVDPDDGIHLDGDIIQLKAVPAAGWRFAGWGGGLVGTDDTRSVTVAGDLAATATFVPVGVSLADWRDARFADEADIPSVAGDTADPDGDGIVNLLEYALGGDPLLPAQGPLWSLDARGGELVLTFALDQQATDVVVSVESTAALGDPLSWSAAGIIQEIVAENAGTKTIEARIPLDGGARFMRLRILP